MGTAGRRPKRRKKRHGGRETRTLRSGTAPISEQNGGTQVAPCSRLPVPWGMASTDGVDCHDGSAGRSTAVCSRPTRRVRTRRSYDESLGGPCLGGGSRKLGSTLGRCPIIWAPILQDSRLSSRPSGGRPPTHGPEPGFRLARSSHDRELDGPAVASTGPSAAHRLGASTHFGRSTAG